MVPINSLGGAVVGGHMVARVVGEHHQDPEGAICAGSPQRFAEENGTLERTNQAVSLRRGLASCSPDLATGLATTTSMPSSRKLNSTSALPLAIAVRRW